jgi:hypothetical protein
MEQQIAPRFEIAGGVAAGNNAGSGADKRCSQQRQPERGRHDHRRSKTPDPTRTISTRTSESNQRLFSSKAL